MTCYAPNVVLQQSFSSTSPKNIFRSNLFTISSVISFYCKTNFTYENKWTLTKIDPNTFANLSAIDLSSNPSSQLSELVIKENTLAYGLYKFLFQVIVKFNGNSQISSNLAETYIQIIPTGLAVFAIENGVSSVLIGTKQSFDLQPSMFSIDFDNIIQPSELNFTYYCKTVNLSDPNSINNLTSKIDLLSYKNNQTLVMDRNVNCFGNSSKITLIFFQVLIKFKNFFFNIFRLIFI